MAGDERTIHTDQAILEAIGIEERFEYSPASGQQADELGPIMGLARLEA